MHNILECGLLLGGLYILFLALLYAVEHNNRKPKRKEGYDHGREDEIY